MFQMKQAKFFVGQVVHHKLFGYRGVVVDVDPQFDGSEQWYEQMAHSRPPKEDPWYHVLVHDEDYNTYVAERNLEPDLSKDGINHPLVSVVFEKFIDGAYVMDRWSN